MRRDVTNNEAAGRYELHVEGDTVVFPHTEIDPSRRGQGLGAVLVQGALDDVRPTGRKIVPACWYVGQFVDENPAYKDLLAS